MIHAHRRPQVANRGRVKPTNTNPGAMSVLDKTVETGQVTPGGAAARNHDGQNAVSLQSSEGEYESLERGAIGPLGVINEKEDRARGLHCPEQLHESRADPDRVSTFTRAAAKAWKRWCL